MKYKLICDTGKPSEEDFKTKKELFNKLLELDSLSTTEDTPYFDVCIEQTEYSEDEHIPAITDVTDEIFKEFNKFKKKQAIEDFNYMRNMAELKALSKFSLENLLNDIQFKRMMELKKVLG